MFNLDLDGSKSPAWVMHQEFNVDVDFCTWVLEVDGLQIPPFDKHQGGNRALRERGMDAGSWQTWIRRVVLLSDKRLDWRVQDPQEELSAKLASLEHAISEASIEYPQLNFPRTSALADATRKYLTWQEKHYQQAAAAAKQVYQESEYPTWCPHSPPDLWNGNSAVREPLRELWQQYFHVVFSRRQENWLKHAGSSDLSGTRALWNLLEPYHSRLPALELYFVAYPVPVEYLVPPVSAILSITNIQSVLQAAEGLAALNGH